ncbi:MAG: hypothetical protein ABIG46_04060 [Candidatus Omnitrophota bacterium]
MKQEVTRKKESPSIEDAAGVFNYCLDRCNHIEQTTFVKKYLDTLFVRYSRFSANRLGIVFADCRV